MNKLFTCEHCLKEFKKHGFYKRHVSICEVVNSRISDSESFDFSNNDLVAIIQLMVKKQRKMENELDSLKKMIKRTNNKMTLLEWINDNYTNNLNLYSWLDELCISDDELEYIFNNSLIDGIFEIIINNIDIENSPILSFVQKPHTLFGFIDNKWQIIDNNSFEKIIQSINSKIFKKFTCWQKQNPNELHNSKYGEDYYENVIRKITGGEQKTNLLISKIKSKLFDNYKINLKHNIEN